MAMKKVANDKGYNRKMNKPRLSVITLTWNSKQYIDGMMGSVEKLNSVIPLELIVADNGSTDGSADSLKGFEKKSDFFMQVILLPKNIGTTIPRNMAIRQAKGDYILIMDSDISFAPQGFTHMLDYLDASLQVGILAPKLCLESGSIQMSVKKFPTFNEKLNHTFGILFRTKLNSKDFYAVLEAATGPMEVETAISAFWLFKRNLLDKVGYLDERIFYAPEDVDYCVRVWLAGLKVVYWPYFTAKHFTQQISHHKPFNWVSISHFLNMVCYFKKHRYFNDVESLRMRIKTAVSNFRI